jgi:phage gp46-like protein
MTDVRLFQTDNDGDIELDASGIITSQGLESAVYLSLFGGNEGDDGSDATASLQWWGNRLDPDNTDRQYRSQTQAVLLGGMPMTSSTLQGLRVALANDLAWLVPSIADAVEIEVSVTAPKRVRILVEVTASDKTYPFEFPQEWGVGVPKEETVWTGGPDPGWVLFKPDGTPWYSYGPEGLDGIGTTYDTDGQEVWRGGGSASDPLIMSGASATVVDWGDGSKALQSPDGVKYRGAHALRYNDGVQPRYDFTAFVVAQMSQGSSSTGFWGLNDGATAYGADLFASDQDLYVTYSSSQTKLLDNVPDGTPFVWAIQWDNGGTFRTTLHVHGYAPVEFSGAASISSPSVGEVVRPWVAGRQSGGQSESAQPIRHVLEYAYLALGDEQTDEQVDALKTLAGIVTT